jgi:hypothetical protein
MINITKAQANQTTTNGTNEDWTVTLGGETLYKLPANFTVQDTFLVRDIVEKMMERATKEALDQAKQLEIVKIERIVTNGDAQLNALKRENIRLSEILEQHIEAA